MTIQTIISETRALLADAEARIATAEVEVGGDNGAKVRAAGELNLLRRHREEMLARLAELEATRDGAVATIVQRLKEEGMLLRQSLENLTVHH
jgi:hypothetical protein